MTSEFGPDFFIVGAPKCGTTAMDSYLGEHPEVFMAKKEQHFFGTDLTEFWAHSSAGRPLDEQEYFAMFRGSEWAARRGEGSGWYLWSKAAAGEIYRYRPSSRILVMLRNPIEVIPSLHSQYLFDGMEDLEDLAEALKAERDRKAGERIPPNNGDEPWRLFYREVVSYREQLERYISTFGRGQVHVILFNDFAADTLGTYRSVLEFLEIDPGFVPTLAVVNGNKRVRSRWLQRRTEGLRRSTPLTGPDGRVGYGMSRMGWRLRWRAIGGLTRFNTYTAARDPLPNGLERMLGEELKPEIAKLETLLDRDLSVWVK